MDGRRPMKATKCLGNYLLEKRKKVISPQRKTPPG